MLKQLCRREDGAAGGPEAGRGYPTHEAVLDFILSTLITPRTVSAVLHAAKKLVSSGVMAPPTMTGPGAAGGPGAAAALLPAPGLDVDAQHGLALLTTALRAVETCLHAAASLTTSAAAVESVAAVAAAAAAAGPHPAAGGVDGTVEAAQPGVAGTAAGAGSGGASPTAAADGAGLARAGGDAPALPGAALPVVPGASGTAASRQPPLLLLSWPPSGPPLLPGLPAAAGSPRMGARPSGVGLLDAGGASLGGGPAGLPLAPGSRPGGTALLPGPLGLAALSRAPHLLMLQPGALPQDPATAAAMQLASALATAHPGASAAAGARAASVASVAGAAAGGRGLAPMIGVAGAGGAYAPHWSAHLHTLIAQLQWDIGVQRHRRRRQHAAQQAARNAAAEGSGAAAPTVAGAGAAGVAAGGQHSRSPSVPIAPTLPLPPTWGAGVPSGRPPTGNSAIPAPGTLTASSRRAPPSMAFSPRALGATPVAPPASAASGAEDSVPEFGRSTSAGPRHSGGLMRSVSSRRGDALQEVIALRHSASAGRASATVGLGQGMAPGLAGAEGSAAAAQASSADDAANLAASAAAAALQEIVDAADAEFADELVAAHGSPAHSGADLVGGADVGGRAVGSAGAVVLPRRRGLQPGGAAGLPSGGAARNTAGASGQHAQAAAGGVSPSKPSGKGKAPGSGLAGELCGQAGDGAGAGGGVASGEEDESDSHWSDDAGVCSICMDMPVAVLIVGCHHGLCVQCAFQLTVKGRELPSCPFCRQKIGGFEVLPPSQNGVAGAAKGAPAVAGSPTAATPTLQPSAATP
jgi:hypothetical protein